MQKTRKLPQQNFVGNIPLSFSDEDIIKAVNKVRVQACWKLFDKWGQDDHGKLTQWKTEWWFVFITGPPQRLPKERPTGPLRGTLYHKKQKAAATCTKCLQKSHHSSACAALVKYRACYQDGHKAGAQKCQLTPHPSPTPPTPSVQTPAGPISTTTTPTISPPTSGAKEQLTAKKQITLPFEQRGHSHMPVRGKRVR